MQQEFKEGVQIAKRSRHEKVRFRVAEVCVDIILESSKSGSLNYQQMNFAHTNQHLDLFTVSWEFIKEKTKIMNKQSPTPNPYDVLEVSSGASNKEITVAFAMAMKRRQYPPDAIALARQSLMNPEERIIADYLRPIIGTVKRFKRSDLFALDRLAPKLEFLSEFDCLDSAIADIGISESDKRLGASLFADSLIQSSHKN